jgi:hypothetical protein
MKLLTPNLPLSNCVIELHIKLHSHSMVKLETWKSRTWLLVDYWGLETVLPFQASR